MKWVKPYNDVELWDLRDVKDNWIATVSLELNKVYSTTISAGTYFTREEISISDAKRNVERDHGLPFCNDFPGQVAQR